MISWLPDVTGEKTDLGFRTSEFADGLPIMITVEPWEFTPTAVSAYALLFLRKAPFTGGKVGVSH